MSIGRRLRSLDERTGAATLGRVGSRIGGYWCLSVGLGALVFGIVDLARGNGDDAVAALALGGVALGIAFFIGPPHMIRRMIGRG